MFVGINIYSYLRSYSFLQFTDDLEFLQINPSQALMNLQYQYIQIVLAYLF